MGRFWLCWVRQRKLIKVGAHVLRGCWVSELADSCLPAGGRCGRPCRSILTCGIIIGFDRGLVPCKCRLGRNGAAAQGCRQQHRHHVVQPSETGIRHAGSEIDVDGGERKQELCAGWASQAI